MQHEQEAQLFVPKIIGLLRQTTKCSLLCSFAARFSGVVLAFFMLRTTLLVYIINIIMLKYKKNTHCTFKLLWVSLSYIYTLKYKFRTYNIYKGNGRTTRQHCNKKINKLHVCVCKIRVRHKR